MIRPFRTRDAFLAAVIRYELGSDVHLSTLIGSDNAPIFEFTHNADCTAILREFYREADEETDGYGVKDARRLLKEAHLVRKTVMDARELHARRIKK